FKTWTDWQISFTIREGTIAVDLIRPLDYQLRMFADALGQMLVNALVITLPSLVMIFGVFGAEIPTGTNLLFFPFSITLAYILSFAFDYIVGLTTFYTESLWGIATSKDIVVTLLSGGLIPLQFFPDSGRRILELLPFQAIYHTPLQIATDPNLSTGDYIALVTVQAFWGLVLIGLSRLFYAQASKVLTINGG
ncbi:MAG: ABC-2 family transporter protein, partial [Anaerolineae bacterium]|nr:ABC-2 family transporter protein [Anaerolineae bacterium]